MLPKKRDRRKRTRYEVIGSHSTFLPNCLMNTSRAGRLDLCSLFLINNTEFWVHTEEYEVSRSRGSLVARDGTRANVGTQQGVAEPRLGLHGAGTAPHDRGHDDRDRAPRASRACADSNVSGHRPQCERTRRACRARMAWRSLEARARVTTRAQLTDVAVCLRVCRSWPTSWSRRWVGPRAKALAGRTKES